MRAQQNAPLFSTGAPKISWRECASRVHIDESLTSRLKGKVYRYASFPEAHLLLTDGAWTFMSPDSWADKYERHCYESYFGSRSAAHVKCFSLQYASEAIWKSHASTAGLVRLTIQIDKLIEALSNSLPQQSQLFIGRVRYMTQPAIRKAVSARDCEAAEAVPSSLFMKRAGFAFEDEVRACFISARPESRSSLSIGGIPSLVVSSILLDPYLAAWQASQFKRVFKENLRFGGSIKQSEFDRAPTAFEASTLYPENKPTLPVDVDPVK